MTLWEAAKEAPGIINTLQAGTTPFMDQVFLGETVGRIAGLHDNKTIEARAQFKNALKGLVLAVGMNPRFPVAEQNRIIGMMPGLGALQSTNSVRLSLKALADELKREARINEIDAKNKSLPRDWRIRSGKSAAAIRNFLPRIGVPDDEKPSTRPKKGADGWTDVGGGVRIRRKQ